MAASLCFILRGCGTVYLCMYQCIVHFTGNLFLSFSIVLILYVDEIDFHVVFMVSSDNLEFKQNYSF